MPRSTFPRWRVLAAWLLLACRPTSLHAQVIDSRAIDELVQAARKAWEIPGVAAIIVHGDRVLYLQGFGVRQLGSPDPVTPDTIFALSSCTKAFITLALAMLVDEGKLHWDDPVRKHVPGFRLADPLADANVTLRDLVSHRTGVASHDFLAYRAPWGQDEQIRRIGLVPPSRSFRSAFQYQNIMFLVAGKAVEAASGMKWSAFVQQRILTPLAMSNTSCTTTAALKSANHTGAHRRNQQGQIEVVPWYPFEEPNAAVSINTNAKDLAKWLQFQLGDGTYRNTRLVAPENLAETHLPQTILRLEGLTRAEHPFTTQMSYGMGWVIQDYRGHTLVSHAGIIDGMRAHIALVPGARLGVAILANLHGTRMNLALSNQIIDQLLHLPYKDWNRHYQDVVQTAEEAEKDAYRQRQARRQRDTRPSHDLSAYVGTYEDPAYGTVRIALAKGTLVWNWSTFHGPLEHFHFDTFTVPNDLLKDPLLVFALDADGTVAGLRVLDVDFKKVKRKE